ncbi:MAG TPA: DUF3775 domain-containing protein [Stellaceae bacterium]|nr:DUF3775 domain-containing protein [Stellaceae bacterium]
MLTIPIDRITILLEQASGVGITPDDDASGSASDDVEATLPDTPALRALMAMLDELTPEEVYDLLAVADIGDSDDAEASWNPALERAQSVAAEEAVAELVRVLVLTDAIENGLDRLGYALDDDGDAEGPDEDEDGEADGGESAAEA